MTNLLFIVEKCLFILSSWWRLWPTITVNEYYYYCHHINSMPLPPHTPSPQEKIRSAQLEESIQRTDQLLYQMIPKPIADQLRNGETPLNTCQEFPSVSILFSDIVSFTPMCSRLRPMEVVCVLNAMYVAFDQLCEKHHVYKVRQGLLFDVGSKVNYCQ